MQRRGLYPAARDLLAPVFTSLISSFITCASLGILENRAGPHQYLSSFGISPRHDRIYPQRFFDFYGQYLYPDAISHIQQLPSISRQRNLTVNHIYRYRPRVLPITQAQLHAYGVHYLSPYKTHRSIFARVGHRVFKPYFHHIPLLSLFHIGQIMSPFLSAYASYISV